MTEKEAIERVKILIKAAEDYFKAFGECCITEDELEAIEIIFSLMKYQQTELEYHDNRIKELEKALEEKDSITNKIYEFLGDLQLSKDREGYEIMKKSDWKQYFEKKEG